MSNPQKCWTCDALFHNPGSWNCSACVRQKLAEERADKRADEREATADTVASINELATKANAAHTSSVASSMALVAAPEADWPPDGHAVRDRLDAWMAARDAAV